MLFVFTSVKEGLGKGYLASITATTKEKERRKKRFYENMRNDCAAPEDEKRLVSSLLRYLGHRDIPFFIPHLLSSLCQDGLTTSRASACAAIARHAELVNVSLQHLDALVSLLEVLVEAVTLGDKMLLPLAEASLLSLDLLGEAAAQGLFLFLELGVVRLARSRLAKLAGLHLGLAVVFVVTVLGGVDEVQHVGADEQRAQLLEVTVVFVLDCRREVTCQQAKQPKQNT